MLLCLLQVQTVVIQEALKAVDLTPTVDVKVHVIQKLRSTCEGKVTHPFITTVKKFLHSSGFAKFEKLFYFRGLLTAFGTVFVVGM